MIRLPARYRRRVFAGSPEAVRLYDRLRAAREELARAAIARTVNYEPGTRAIAAQARRVEQPEESS